MYVSNDDPTKQHPTGRAARMTGNAPLVRQKPPRLTRQDRRQLLAELRDQPLLGTCDEADLTALIKASVPCSLPPQWALMSEGTPADFCYVVLKGTAEVFRAGRRIAQVGPGALIGEMAVLTGDLRSATVTTTTRVSALAIANANLIPMLRKRPGLDRALRQQAAQRTRRPTATTLPPRG